MPPSKSAYLRYRVLDECFRNSGRNYTLDDLLEKVNEMLREQNPGSGGIKRRQLQDDIRVMKTDLGAPIESFRGSDRKHFYRYSDRKFSIKDKPLDDTSAQKIREALRIMQQFSGIPQFEWFQEAIPLMESKLGLISSQEAVIGMDSNKDLRGLNFLGDLFGYIVNRRVLEITYRDFKSEEPYAVLMHPYYLREYNHRWFLLGYHPERDTPYWVMALDRIQEIKETYLPYRKSNIDWEYYFSDFIGITRNEEYDSPVEVLIEVDESLFPYINTKPLHETQRIKSDEPPYHISINVIPNFELEALLLSFGEKVRVIGPEKLRERILERMRRGVEGYGE